MDDTKVTIHERKDNNKNGIPDDEETLTPDCLLDA